MAQPSPERQGAAKARAFVDHRGLAFGRLAEQLGRFGAGDHGEAGVVDLVVKALEHAGHGEGVLEFGRCEEQDGEWAGRHVVLITTDRESFPARMEDS